MTPAAEASASVSESGGDPLVSNGLGSPMCRPGSRAELSPTDARNCRISGFEAAQAPTGDYGFDVHINTGVTDVANDVDAEILNGVQWGWTLLVAIVHGVIVMLEWCYAIDLLNSGAMGGIARGLRETQATFTQPWLVLALAIASVLALYHGIVRRRVAETLGQVLLMGGMMVGGFWVILNPLGTVGALDAWANEASMGTLAAVATGTPEHSGRTLGESMRSVFSGAIGGPWCYMEFGNFSWCNDERRLDPRLEKVGLEIAAKEQAKIGSQSAELLRAAHTNGELFLALPANGPARNSINESGSLFNVLCGGSEEPCKGPTATEAAFRTGGGTLWRVAGLWVFWAGVLGMVLVLGFIGMRLLAAALFSLFFLLLAPAAVIAPALGDGGRVAFRSWVTRLLGAVCAKLIYSFLLGVVLLMARTLMTFDTFGWMVRWLLVSTMWWWLFLKRHQIDGFAHGEHRAGHEHRSLLRQVRERAHNPPEAVRAAKWVKGKLRTPAPSVERRRKLAQAAGERAKRTADGQVKRVLEREHGEAHALVQAAPETEARISAKRTQLERVRRAHADAQAKAQAASSAREAALTDPSLFSPLERDRTAAKFGAQEESHRRHAARLRSRVDRLGAEIAGEQGSLTAARRTVDSGANARRGTGYAYTREQAQEQDRLLDVQAALPSRGRAGPGGEGRDYASSAGLVGYGRREFEALDRPRKREAQLEIDRELALRKETHATTRGVAAGAGGVEALGRRERKQVDRQIDRTVEQNMRAGGHELPSSIRPKPKPKPKRPGPDAHPHEGRARARGGGSSVMRDAQEVAARRKRQLGGERRP
jgi:hypothetical protein